MVASPWYSEPALDKQKPALPLLRVRLSRLLLLRLASVVSVLWWIYMEQSVQSPRREAGWDCNVKWLRCIHRADPKAQDHPSSLCPAFTGCQTEEMRRYMPLPWIQAYSEKRRSSYSYPLKLLNVFFFKYSQRSLLAPFLCSTERMLWACQFYDIRTSFAQG